MSGEIDKISLLPLVKSNNLMELFPKMLNIEKENFNISPSDFIKEMSFSTEERHKLLIQICNTKQILENDYPSQLKIIPHILCFQKFEARSTNIILLQIKNVGKNLLSLKMHCPTSLYFSASPAGTPMHKLAPGLTAEYKIVFTPKEAKDYSHQLQFKCKEDVFYVPIIAIGPRALLDIPDRIILNPAPVKLSVNKCIVIRNIGDVPASFNFITKSPFKVSPTKGFLKIYETMILNVTFESFKLGEETGELYLIFETGEKLTVALQGVAENACIQLDKSSIIHEDTFLGLKRCKSLHLYNNSSSVVKFSWKKNKSFEDDLKIIKRQVINSSLEEKYRELNAAIILKDARIKYFELGNFENHKHVCERILKDELQKLEKEEFKFFHEAFSITPESGEVWPKRFAELIVSFEPKHCTTFTSEAYLEVSGLETRLPLQLRGIGLGPKIMLSPQTLDINYIYLCSQHSYEVIAVNKGDIPGKIEYKVETSIFGGKIEVEPNSRHLNPGECGVFIISFTSNKQGEFIEQLTFNIKESGEMVSFVLTGKIISPTLHFDRSGIDFGIIPFGFPTVQDVNLKNLSVVPVTFSLKVLMDGNFPSLSHKRFASLTVKPLLPASPKEFHIEPEESIVEPFSSKRVTLTLTANKTGRFLTYLEMDMWDSESGSVSCPIRYHSVVPTISAEPESITIPFCFINFPYTRSIILKNSSKVAGFFYIVPLDPNENSPTTCSANIPQGIIGPKLSVKIDITVITSALGRQVIPINLLVFGHEGYREVCTILCMGQGPVVTVSPNNLHWGEIPLLEENQKTLLVCNESPIPATLSIWLVKGNSRWSVSAPNLTLAPSESIPVPVTLFLNDRGKFKDTLKVSVHNGKVLSIYLSATGVGSSLKINPNINPTYDLGTLFSHKKYEIPIDVENKGTKMYALVWSPFQEYAHFMSLKLVNPSNLIFKIEPTKMNLMPGERKTINLIVQSSSTGYFQQTFYCFASIGNPTKELHFTSQVFADFVEPLINFDKKELRYWHNIGYDGTEQKLEDSVEISNLSILPLKVNFSVRHPFRIHSESKENIHSLEVQLRGNKSKRLTIKFLPEIQLDRISRTYNANLVVTFQEHSKKFILALTGEVNYPNLLILPRNINFDFVPLATNVYREINLVNTSPLTVYYHITWNSLTSRIMHPKKELEQVSSMQNLKNSKESFGETELEVNQNLETEEVVNDTEIRRFDSNVSQRLTQIEEPVAKMPKIEISRTDIKKTIFPFAKNHYDREEELMNAYRLAPSETSDRAPDFAKVCDITPFYGKLEKFSSQTLAVRFCSDTVCELHLEAMINIKSGPSETVKIDAVSSEINFRIDNTELDFGKQLFCKPSSRTLKIQNTGEMQFFYETSHKKECQVKGGSNQDVGIITVSPYSGIVESFSETVLTVTYLPRIPGNFEQTFKLQIAYLDPVIIKLKGFGAFPQVFIYLPRTDISTLPPEIGYFATASITSDWILNEFPTYALGDVHSIKPYRSQESNLDELSIYEEPDALRNQWDFLESLERIPTDADIQLAIERVLAINLMAQNPENQMNFAVYARSIPDFVVPAYEADFGIVVIGRRVERNITVTNFGPLPAVLYARFNAQLKMSGIQVRLKNRNELMHGTSFYFAASFFPKRDKYSKQFEVVEGLFHFEIYHGPKVPIRFLATVTYPFVISSCSILNYFDVVCGCCKVMNLKLKNPGLVPAPWSLVFLVKHTDLNQDLNTQYKDGTSMFHLNHKSGTLYPEQCCTIRISFKPDFEGKFSATLWVQVAESLEELKVVLIGEGIEPKLYFSDNILQFGSTPPYPNKLDRYFTIENPCSFPIEFYFPAFDEQIFEENKILRAVCSYYQSKEILLPVRRPGEGLPPELVNFYRMLLEDLNAKFLEEEREKSDSIDENFSGVLSCEDDLFLIPSQKSFSDKKKKRHRKSISRTRTNAESSRILNSESEMRKETSVYSIFQKKTSSEIDEMLQYYIKELLNSNPEYDPIQAALKSTIPPIREPEYKEGLLIIFHGAPYSNSIQLANRAALLSNLPTLSIDRIVLEEAALTRCEAGQTAKDLIEEAYWDHIEIKGEKEIYISESEESKEFEPNFDGGFEEMERKFSALISLRDNLIANKGKVKTPSIKSEGSKKDMPVTPLLKPMNVNGPIANITEDLVMEILKFRLPIEVSRGVILEGLNSIFFNSCVKVLMGVLKAAGNINDIITIFLLNNYAQYNQKLLIDQMKQDDVKNQFREQILNIFEEAEDEKIMELLLDLKVEEEELKEIRSFFIQKRHTEKDLFEKKKEIFYEIIKAKTLGKAPSLNLKFESPPNKSQTEKKKEGGKVVVAGGRTGSEDKTGKNKKDPIEVEFGLFEAELKEMKAIVENWDQRIGATRIDVAPEVKVKKGQTPRRTSESSHQSSSIGKMNPAKGIHVWLADVSRPEKNLFSGICCHLKAVLQNRYTTKESDQWPLNPTDGMTFSVVSCPPKNQKPFVSDIFELALSEPILPPNEDFEELIDDLSTFSTSINERLNRSTSQISFKGKKKGSITAKRRKLESRTSTEIKSLASTTKSEVCNFKSRWILQPGEILNWRVRYFPQELGKTTQQYPVSIVNWPGNNTINCIGMCDIPALDMTPEVVFLAVTTDQPLEKTGSVNPVFSTCYYSDDTYDFGSIVLPLNNDENKKSGRKAEFVLVNKSTLPVDLSIISSREVNEDEIPDPSLKFEPEKVYLKPGESDLLKLAVSPNKYGPESRILMFLVKDNPKVELIKLKFEGVKANITVEPKSINFDRILLRRKDFREVIFTNNNSTPLYIALKDLEEAPSQFTFSQTNGWIEASGLLKVDVYYESFEVQQIIEQPFRVQVFEDESEREIVQEFTMSLSVEAYDVALDVIFSDKDGDHVDFGLIRVESNSSKIFNLRNSGKYPLGFKIFIGNDTMDCFKDCQVFVFPLEGILQPGKLYPVTVSVNAVKEMDWNRASLIKILLVEPNKGDELIAKIPLEISARSFLPRYEITPYPDFNFGHVRVCSMVTGSLLVENKGHFPLSYEIEQKSSSQFSERHEETNKKSSKPSASSKEKEDKGKKSSSVLTIGPFEISPTSGIIEVEQVATIKITGRFLAVKSYEETVVLTVNQSPSLLQKRNEIILAGEGCLPSLDFDNLKAVFREHFFVKNKGEFNCPPKFDSYTLFTENDFLFSFKNVCLCKTAEARIHLPNNGLVECHVHAKVSLQLEGSRTSNSENSCCFAVSPNELIIEPYNFGTLTLIFQPEALEEYKGWLIITLEMPEICSDVIQKFQLYGNGVLPQIEIIEPASKLPEGQTLVNFAPTTPKRSSTAAIAFTNVGPLACRVILELIDNRDGVFSLIPKSKTEKMLKVWESGKPIDHTVMLTVIPGEVAEFTVAFSPKDIKSYSSQIKLFPIDNPFENLCYKLTGEGYFEEVVIEKIRTILPFLKDDPDDSESPPICTFPGQYILNFNDCSVKKEAKALLRLLNKTQKDYFRFEWEEFQSITVSPSVGHLYPNSYKEILITFLPEEPMELLEIPLVCTLNKILFETPADLAWDSRLNKPEKLIKQENTPSPESKSNSKKESAFYSNIESMKTIREEPDCEIIPETTRMLFINVSGSADYARLLCEASNITFKNTFMFQTRKYPLTLQNCSNVTLEYKLTMSSVTVWPLKESKMTQIRETSFAKEERSRDRPQSSISASSDVNTSSGTSNIRRCRPRPLTSVPLLNLNKNDPSSAAAESPSELPEVQKTVTYNPFSLEHLSGQIQPKEKATCNIIFSPMDINEYKAILNIHVPNLHPECRLPQILVTASSIMPYCHFNVSESDYLASGRRDYSRPGPIGCAPGLPLNPDTKAIEIKVLGIGQNITIKFHVINPTEEDYTFSWVNVTQVQPDAVQPFHCSTLDGRIQAGRQQQMIFNFVSQKPGIAESFWKFHIPKYNVEALFLLVGDVREPSVYFLSNHVNLRPNFIGSSSSDLLTLVNHENDDFEFKFIPESVYSEGRLNALNVEPMSGKVPANSDTPIRVTFTGKTGGKVLFFLKCKVKGIEEAFTIAVEAMTYIVQPLVIFEDFKKIKHNADSETDNLIDFGTQLTPKRPEAITFVLTNISKTSFYYDWIYDKEMLESCFCKLKVSSKSGHVSSFSKGNCDLSISFSKKSSLNNFPVKLKISRGPCFNFIIKASSSTPCCEFSFTSLDFGYCFVQERDICYNQVPLVIRNKDTVDLALEVFLPETSAFSYALQETTIRPQEEIVALINFHPKKIMAYSDVLKFVINGLHERLVTLKGHGTEFKVTLESANDTIISLGPVKAGKSFSRKFTLINKSLAPANLLVGFSDQLPVNGIHLAQPERNFIDLLSIDHRLKQIITILPSNVFTIKPKKEFEITVIYTPRVKSSNFSETVSLQYQEKVEPVCMLTGCCIGPEISLDRSFLNFGAVVKDCSSKMKLKLLNLGNIGVKFEWMFETLRKEYTVYPVSGYCFPESDVTIEISFRPTSISNCIKDKVECKLYLSDSEMYPSLFLSVTGNCIDTPLPKGTVSFECTVRETDVKAIEIENSSGNVWQLLPIFSGDYFKGSDALVVPALSSANYEITYCPMLMTAGGALHEGSVFFRLPNGQGLLYQLEGTSLAPGPEDIITREIPCKTKYVELLKIKNWLQYSQRLKVQISCVSNESEEDPVWSCTGLKNLDLPPLTEKEYHLNFFAYKPCNLRFNVTFMNEETKEYKWFDVSFKIVICGPVEVITLKCGVRQTCHHEIKLENPLEKVIQYKLTASSPEIHFENDFYHVDPKTPIYAKISYTPIHAVERTARLTAECSELGTFLRELRLVAVDVQSEPTRTFETPLGSSQTQLIPVKNFSHLNAVLNCTTDSDDFIVNEVNYVGPGEETQIEVTHEPSEMTTTMANVFVDSKEAGNFVFPLLGICVKPLAKGPFLLKPGSGVNIIFKNVFKKSKDFCMYVDNPVFRLKTSQENIPPKSEYEIYVELEKVKNLGKLGMTNKDKGIDSRFPFTGQLIVECYNPYIKWQFYLKGIVD